MQWIAMEPQPDSVAPASAWHSQLADPLTALGWWALQFSPRVTLLDGTVLLEVSASERLWGGRAALLRHIYASNKPVAQVKHAHGATSLIAFGRLMAAQEVSVKPDALPLAALVAARPHLGTLARIGCITWGQLRALPRGGVARRFGAGLLHALDQAYGTQPDVYPWLTLPEVFEARLELAAQVDSAPALLFGARRLLSQLQVWLQMRQRGVLAIELGWTMDARRNTATQGALVIRTAELTHDMAHLQRLLGERLASVTLPAPVHYLRLRSLETRVLTGRSNSLLLDEQLPGDSLAHLIERLSARLGPHKVLQIQACADHRPEHMQVWEAASNAIQFIAVDSGYMRARGLKSINNSAKTSFTNSHWASALYPTWLLAEPLRLSVHQQRPYYQGLLTLLAGPQRLEAGWWGVPSGAAMQTEPQVAALQAMGSGASSGDTGPRASGPVVLRDYYVARSDRSPLLWIYRERLDNSDPAQPSSAWFLHGVFA